MEPVSDKVQNLGTPTKSGPKVFSSYHYLANLGAWHGVFLPVLQEQLVLKFSTVASGPEAERKCG